MKKLWTTTALLLLLSLAVQADEARAKKYFVNSVSEAMARVSNEVPKQVDLYILSHALMYNQRLSLDIDKDVIEEIKQYFLSTVGEESWALEGCLPPKVFIGLSRSGVSMDRLKAISTDYGKRVIAHWGESGVGEFFSTTIDRTYGVNAKLKPSRPTREMAAKVGYWKAMINSQPLPLNRSNPFAVRDAVLSVNTEEADFSHAELIANWSQSLPELWVVLLRRDFGASGVSQLRFQNARNNLARAVEKVDPNTKPNTYFLSSLLFGYFASIDENPSPKSLKLMSYLESIQNEDGSIPSSYRIEGHNTAASPTYLYLAAANELRRVLGR